MRQLCYQFRTPRRFAVTLAIALSSFVGCGTTRSTDTGRTATEQLLISDAIDRAVQTVDFGTLKGQTVYLDDSRLAEAVDRNYLVSTLRQHLLASGCALRDKKEEAEFIVEARAGAIGTDRNDLLFGLPSMNVPQIMPAQPTPAAIPEIPVAKRRDQRGIAKIAVFAYHRQTGAPVWQSGLAQQESSSNDVWILGAGPFQRGTIYEGTTFAGQAIGGANEKELPPIPQTSVALRDEQQFASPAGFTAAAPASATGATVAATPTNASSIPDAITSPVMTAAAQDALPSGSTSANAPYSQLFARPPRSPAGEVLTAHVDEERRPTQSPNRYEAGPRAMDTGPAAWR